MMILWDLFITFFKIGILTFGGGYAMIPMIESEAIAKGWISSEMLINFLAVSESTPGSFAVNISTFIGNSQAGFMGAMVATLGVVTPSFIIIIIVFQFYRKFITNRYVMGVMVGLRAVVVGLIFSVAIGLFYDELITIGEKVPVNYVSLILFAILFAVQFGYKKITKRKLNPILFIVIAAILGIITFGVIVK